MLRDASERKISEAGRFFFSWKTTEGRTATKKSKMAASRSPSANQRQAPDEDFKRGAYAQSVNAVTTTANAATTNQLPTGSKLTLTMSTRLLQSHLRGRLTIEPVGEHALD